MRGEDLARRLKIDRKDFEIFTCKDIGNTAADRLVTLRKLSMLILYWSSLVESNDATRKYAFLIAAKERGKVGLEAFLSIRHKPGMYFCCTRSLSLSLSLSCLVLSLPGHSS